MAEPTGFQKARLDIEVDSAWSAARPDPVLDRQGQRLDDRPVVGASLPQTQFAGGRARELALELLFDAAPAGDVTTRPISCSR